MSIQGSFGSKYDFRTSFPTEEVCREYLSGLLWKKKPYCPFCRHTRIYSYKSGKLYKCAKCRKQFSVRAGTLLEESKVSVKKWFHAIYLITSNKKGTSSLQLAREIGVTQKTAWFMLEKLSQAPWFDSNMSGFRNHKTISREPKMGRVPLSFEKFIRNVLIGGRAASVSKEKSKGKPAAEETINYQRPSRDFDPETD